MIDGLAVAAPSGHKSSGYDRTLRRRIDLTVRAFERRNTNMPPRRLVESPIAATVISMRVPGWAKGGRSAVTSTAAVFRTRTSVGETVTPMRCNRFVRLWVEKMVVFLIAGAVQAHHQTIADQLIVPHAFNRNQVFQARAAGSCPERSAINEDKW